MLIITQTFLKKNNLFLLYVFKGELSNWQKPPEGQDCLRKKGVVPGDGKLEAQAGLAAMVPIPSCSHFLELQSSKPHQAMSEVVPLMSLSGLLLLPMILWSLS